MKLGEHGVLELHNAFQKSQEGTAQQPRAAKRPQNMTVPLTLHVSPCCAVLYQALKVCGETIPAHFFAPLSSAG